MTSNPSSRGSRRPQQPRDIAVSSPPSDAGTPTSTAGEREPTTPGPYILPRQPRLQPLTPIAGPSSDALHPDDSSAMSPASVMTSGPLSSIHTVPARPKPGRKTAQDEPTSKRKAQNRQAQRAFRQRKQEQAVSLEESNKLLTNEVERLDTEILELRSLLEQRNDDHSRVVDATNDSQRRLVALQNQLRAETARNDNLLNAQKAFQEQAREANTLRQQCQDLQSQLALLQHHQRETLPDGSVRLPRKRQMPSRPAQSVEEPPPKRATAKDGCGNCEETGECPCVDTFIDTTGTPGRDMSATPGPSSRNRPTAMSISSMLSPQVEAPSPRPSQSAFTPLDEFPNRSEVEIDFTTYPQPSEPSLDPSAMAESHHGACGFCTNPDNCLCDPPAAPTPSASEKLQPGTCPSCQQNPEQKAFCESLAAERTANLAGDRTSPSRHVKRPRLDAARDVTIPCADAFPLYKRLSRASGKITYDALYKEYMQGQPGSSSSRGSPRQGEPSRSAKGKGRQFSAFEADIGEVLASMHKQGRSSGHGRSHGGSSGKGRSTDGQSG